jgi:hypothetical protein
MILPSESPSSINVYPCYINDPRVGSSLTREIATDVIDAGIFLSNLS